MAAKSGNEIVSERMDSPHVTQVVQYLIRWAPNKSHSDWDKTKGEKHVGYVIHGSELRMDHEATRKKPELIGFLCENWDRFLQLHDVRMAGKKPACENPVSAVTPQSVRDSLAITSLLREHVHTTDLRTLAKIATTIASIHEEVPMISRKVKRSKSKLLMWYLAHWTRVSQWLPSAIAAHPDLPQPPSDTSLPSTVIDSPSTQPLNPVLRDGTTASCTDSVDELDSDLQQDFLWSDDWFDNDNNWSGRPTEDGDLGMFQLDSAFQ